MPCTMLPCFDSRHRRHHTTPRQASSFTPLRLTSRYLRGATHTPRCYASCFIDTYQPSFETLITPPTDATPPIVTPLLTVGSHKSASRHCRRWHAINDYAGYIITRHKMRCCQDIRHAIEAPAIWPLMLRYEVTKMHYTLRYAIEDITAGMPHTPYNITLHYATLLHTTAIIAATLPLTPSPCRAAITHYYAIVAMILAPHAVTLMAESYMMTLPYPLRCRYAA